MAHPSAFHSELQWLKAIPKRATLSHLQDMLDHLMWVEPFTGVKRLLEGIPREDQALRGNGFLELSSNFIAKHFQIRPGLLAELRGCIIVGYRRVGEEKVEFIAPNP